MCSDDFYFVSSRFRLVSNAWRVRAHAQRVRRVSEAVWLKRKKPPNLPIGPARGRPDKSDAPENHSYTSCTEW